jgi:hypothetical protein
VEEIGESAFGNCSALKTVILRNGKTKIPVTAFDHNAKVQIVRP